jgi:hypothetical protein
MSNRPAVLNARKIGKRKPSGVAHILNDGTVRDAGYTAVIIVRRECGHHEPETVVGVAGAMLALGPQAMAQAQAKTGGLPVLLPPRLKSG